MKEDTMTMSIITHPLFAVPFILFFVLVLISQIAGHTYIPLSKRDYTVVDMTCVPELSLFTVDVLVGEKTPIIAKMGIYTGAGYSTISNSFIERVF